MRSQIHRTRGRAGRLSAALVLLAGASGTALILTAVPASASGGTCGDSPTATSCTTDGSAGVAGGSLALEAPDTLSWSDTLSGLNQYTAASATSFTAVDPTGSGDGWTVSAEATQFTGTDTDGDTNTLPTSALVFNGSTSSLSGAAPGNDCATNSTCTAATDTVSDYPVAVSTTEATPIYSADTNTGLGAIVIGGTGNPAGWLVTVPAKTLADTYSATVTLSIDSLPPVS